MIIGITGKKNSGKTTLAHMMSDFDPSIQILSFAEPLKKMLFDTGICTYDEIYVEKTPFSRKMMQKIGTDIVRKIKPSYWDNIMLKKIERHKGQPIIIDDLRFMTEYELIKDLKGTIIRITRPQEDKDHHRSETEMDQIIPDIEIHNNFGFDELSESAKQIYKFILKEQI